MKLGLSDLLVPVSTEDRVVTKTFYESRTSGVGPRSFDELQTARAARAVDRTTPT